MTEEKKVIPIPMEFMDEPNGDADMVLEYQGCPLVTIRGTDDMSCIDNDEDEEKFRLDQLAIAKYTRTAINSHYDLLEALKKLIPLAEDGYKLHVKNCSHQEFLNDDRDDIAFAKEQIQKAEQL